MFRNISGKGEYPVANPAGFGSVAEFSQKLSLAWIPALITVQFYYHVVVTAAICVIFTTTTPVLYNSTTLREGSNNSIPKIRAHRIFIEVCLAVSQ